MKKLSERELANQYYLDQKRIEAIGNSFADLSESQRDALSQMTVRRINDTRSAALNLLSQGQAQNLSEAWDQAALSLLPN